MRDIYDVIIVGAGPGGATAAYYLGKSGKRVLVLEKESLPRYKPCGGGLSAHMLEKIFPFSFEPVIETRVRAVAYAFGGRTISIAVPDHAVRTVMRDKFDEHILAHARADVRQGIAVRKVTETNDRVIVETADGAVFESRYLIGADGAKSVVARDLGMRRGRTMAAAIEAEVHVRPEVRRRYGDELLFIFGSIRMGYAWIFPKADHLSVGIAALHPRRGELQTALSMVMARYGISLDKAELHGHPIPIYTHREPIATSRALLVGDAAGLADPFTGEGIRIAIKSGRIAAQAILSREVAQYPDMIYREIGISQTFALGLAWLFYHFPRLCITLAAPNPFSTYAFMDLLADRADYPEVIFQLFASLPVYWMTEGIAMLVSLFGGSQRGKQIRSTVYSGAGD